MSDLDYGLDGKVVWVTGASRGLGRSLVMALAEQGAHIAMTARDGEALASIEDELSDHPVQVKCLPGSVSEAGNASEFARSVVETFGTIDVLINNAGVSPSYVDATRLEESVWRQTIETNLTGAFFCSQEAGRVMVEQGSGAIVNVSSVYGHVGGERLVAYAASKAGMEAMTKTLALEWASRGVRVNSVAPGYLWTDLTRGLLEHEVFGEELLDQVPMGRFGTVEDVIPAILHLASPLSGYTTGTSLLVDGGWTAR